MASEGQVGNQGIVVRGSPGAGNGNGAAIIEVGRFIGIDPPAGGLQHSIGQSGGRQAVIQGATAAPVAVGVGRVTLEVTQQVGIAGIGKPGDGSFPGIGVEIAGYQGSRQAPGSVRLSSQRIIVWAARSRRRE